ncbi:MAG: YceI family protein [Croceimicrobium sp.]|nr:YceI family protein [Bacteroidota bacterium]
MKIAKQLLSLSLVASMFVACNNAPETNVEAEEAQAVDETKTAEAASYAALTDGDEISWRGFETLSGDDHTGVIQVSDGELKVENGALVGGKIVIDMTSINDQDLEGEYKAKLEGHLKSADFFAVDSFPTATFEITNVAPIEATNDSMDVNQNITGNLTLRGITKSITFAAKVSVDDNNVSLMANDVRIDRSQWNVRFRSTSFAEFAEIAKEKVIDNTLELQINMQAAKS